MRQTVGPDMGVKASGGARSYEDALAFIEAGATRIGTSSGVASWKVRWLMATTELIDLAVEVSQQAMCLTLISQLELYC